jgi:putative thioredoxin
MRFPSDQPPCADCFDVDHDGFEQAVIEASRTRPVLVDFWADWCAPCHQLAPHLYRVIDELEGAVGLAKVEVDEGENMKLAGHYRLRGFPTVLLFQQGEEHGRFSGSRSSVQIRAWLDEHLEPPSARRAET